MQSQQEKNDVNSMDKLRSGLYSRDVHPSVRRTRPLSGESYGDNDAWQHNDEKKQKEKPVFFEEKRGISFASKILIVSFVFFLIASGVSFYKFYGGSNTISPNNIDILITGPTSVSGGEKISLDVMVHNNNNIDLKSAELRMEYPEGARSPEDLKTEIKRSRDSLGNITQGGSVSKRVEVVLFGEEKSVKNIKVVAEYRVQGSSAIFYKEKTYEIVISDSPVNIEIVGLKETNANQIIEFDVTVNSNSSGSINNLLLKVEYPFGFIFIDSSDSSIGSNDDVWDVGNLSPGSSKTIKIKGKLGGQDGEDKVFRFTTGVASDKDEKVIAIPLVTSLATVSIKKPFIGIEFALDGNVANEFVSKSSKIIRADVAWKNNLQTPIEDAEIQVKFEGGALNKASVHAERGFYRSIDNTIVFSKADNPDLASIDPGESGNLSFSFGGLSSYSSGEKPVKEASISLNITAKGKRLQGGNVPQEILYSSTKVVKILTDINLSSRIIYWSGPFQNTGPIPPKAEQETTYTIVWAVTNTSNKVKNVEVKATLPVYVKWLSRVSPESENISFNSSASEVLWDVGDVEAGAGISSPAKEVSFQVSFLPSMSQVGSAPIILKESSLVGTDDFTSTTVTDTSGALSTTLRSDPDFKNLDDQVVK